MVIETSTIQKIVYGFTFAFYSNYVVTIALFCIISHIK